MAGKRKGAKPQKSAAELRRELAAAKRKIAEQKKALARQKKLADARKKARAKRKKAPEPVRITERKYKGKLGRVEHVAARESEGEPQYAWKELEEKIAPKLKRPSKKARKKRWARLVVELDKRSLLFPKEYRKLRGKPVIRTGWYPAHEFVGKAAEVVDKLQMSGAVAPRMRVTFVQGKKPGRRLF